MYLKTIEMQGFKSFADKTRLTFHNGVTCIVGPNGSGKSNVADAVRWVLGEQSAKQLRGGSMQDVIFSGTETRKPLGYAGVSITLDNSDRVLKFDADEITVTRKLYRSGESEYLLNGRNCRLRDINELFYDTGIGKEGYSLIGQGQIDRILSGKPEDRRELFDEAAGIVTFKRRKAASLKKLEDEQSNLVRVNDILQEVTRQIGPLEKQAEKAEAYLQKRDRLRTMEIQMFQIDEKRTDEERASLQEKKKIAEEQMAGLKQAFDQTRQEYDRVEKQIDEIEQKLSASRDASSQAAVEKQQKEGQADVLKAQVSASEENTRLQQERLTSLREEKRHREETADSEREAGKRLKEQLSEAEKNKTDKEKAAENVSRALSDRREEAEKGRMETIRLLNDRSSIRARMQRYDTMLEQIGIRKSELHARMLEMKGSEAEEKEKLDSLEQQFRKTAEAVASLNEKISGSERQLAGFKETLTEDNRKLEAAQTAFHRDSSRLESLRNVTERYEGYANSIRKVMEQKDRNAGIHGVVADLIKTEKKYETAIETALGGSLQNIVTDNETTAKYLIEYLKKGHFGRATFLPLTAMRDKIQEGNPEVLREPGVLGKADALVSCDSMYEGVAHRLLGKTYVVDTIDHAIAVSRRHHQSVRMVTLEGELLSPGGSMTGGSFRYSSNLLSRRREISELSESVRKWKQQAEELQKDIDDTRAARNTVRETLAQDQEKLQGLNLQLNTAKVNVDHARSSSESLRTEYEKLSQELEEIGTQIREIKEKKTLIGGELSDSQKEEDTLKEKIRKLSGESDALSEKEKQALEEQDQARLAYSGILQQAAFSDEKIRTAEEEIQRLDEQIRALEISTADSGSDREEKQAQIARTASEIGQLEQRIAALAEQTRQYEAEKEAMNRDHRAFFEKRDALSGQIGEMEKELFRLDARLEKLEEERDAQISSLYENYGMTPDQAEEMTFEKLPDRGPLKKEIAGARAEIRAMGDVNVNAVGEYRELKERHDFLQGQHDDLVKAADALNGIISQLDEDMRKQFRERFEAIRTEFDRVFRELFGGGRGTLELVEGEDILESGIVIISQPPGKKLQNMMQLSGGEKALTAIALLFAIQNLKPSPFCLLDEIEAALDDNNVGRFASYLHKLTKHTQFIVITHRRGTMAAADRLYGITMQEKGISTLVSVDLIENTLTA